jgi:HlyD family secretion protein
MMHELCQCVSARLGRLPRGAVYGAPNALYGDPYTGAAGDMRCARLSPTRLWHARCMAVDGGPVHAVGGLMKRMFAAAALAALILSVLLGFKIREQRAALTGPAGGSGVVEGTSVRVAARVGGRVLEVSVVEGQQVAAGERMLTLDCEEPRAALAEGAARVEAARSQAETAERAAEAGGAAASAADAGVGAVTAQGRAVEVQGDAAGRQAGRLEGVGADVSDAQRDQARAAADGAAAQIDALAAQRRVGVAQARAAHAQADAAGLQAQAARAAVAAAEAGMARAQLAVEECAVRAPAAGTVQLLPYAAGELVGPGVTLATIVDLGKVEAAFYLPNADLAAVQPGGEALLSADAWPDREFRGRVTTVATEAEFTPRNIQTRTDRDRLVYRVVVAVDNPEGALRPGMPVEVRLLGGEVR